IKTSLSIDRSHTHGKTLRPTPSIVNIYSIDMTKYQEGFSAESIVMSDPNATRIVHSARTLGVGRTADTAAGQTFKKEKPS
ncbi:MAG TPA: hypothetical protein VEQ38_14045, partial [Verrucomicrobiae bacterium]|nr:hypothetical protein [Verrucomicrobiae bacterium]